ncbi:MAG: hypothetical protein AABX01_03440 [Candidatus Micrarchaeota archaeon]
MKGITKIHPAIKSELKVFRASLPERLDKLADIRGVIAISALENGLGFMLGSMKAARVRGIEVRSLSKRRGWPVDLLDAVVKVQHAHIEHRLIDHELNAAINNGEEVARIKRMVQDVSKSDLPFLKPEHGKALMLAVAAARSNAKTIEELARAHNKNIVVKMLGITASPHTIRDMISEYRDAIGFIAGRKPSREKTGQ